jgi:hypothetical protein
LTYAQGLSRFASLDGEPHLGTPKILR